MGKYKDILQGGKSELQSLYKEDIDMSDIKIPEDKKEINKHNRADALFLGRLLRASDWYIVRHQEQILIEATKSLSDEEFSQLCSNRQTMRETICELLGWE